ncbi:MAG: glycosyltransferase, partial [Candidatus Aenigmatarchaeota archaeon]
MTTLADEFLERGIDTDIVLMRREGSLEDSVPSQARVFDLEAQNIIWGPPTLAQYLRRRRPSVLLSAGYTNRIALLARELIQSSTSIVISEHNVVSNSGSNSSLPDWLLQQLTKWTYPLSEQMIAVSEGVADDVSQSLNLRREDFEVVYNPVIGPETFERAEQTVEHPWFSDASLPLILGVGRLVEQKDFSTLLQA